VITAGRGGSAAVTGRVDVRLIDFRSPGDAEALLALLDVYARDPAGGGTALTPDVLARLIPELECRPTAFSVIAWRDTRAVGLINCFEGFSTFAAQPLINVHDVVVLAGERGQGIAGAMLTVVEAEARRRGACKLTLEVLSGNQPALRAYAGCGFEPYALSPAFGTATFLQKQLF
jgi:GNAT superfamily N-acetyltransferase